MLVVATSSTSAAATNSVITAGRRNCVSANWSGATWTMDSARSPAAPAARARSSAWFISRSAAAIVAPGRSRANRPMSPRPAAPAGGAGTTMSYARVAVTPGSTSPSGRTPTICTLCRGNGMTRSMTPGSPPNRDRQVDIDSSTGVGKTFSSPGTNPRP